MADEEQGVETTPTSDTTGASTTETGKDGTPFDATRAQSTIDALRAEVKGLKGTQKERDELAAKVKEFEQARLSETERVSARLKDAEAKAADLESKYQAALIRSAVEREATKAGAVDADVVYALIDRSELTLGDDGSVTGADKAVKALLDAKPYLKAGGEQAGTTAKRGVPATPKPSGQQTTRAEQVEQARKELAGSGRYAPL